MGIKGMGLAALLLLAAPLLAAQDDAAVRAAVLVVDDRIEAALLAADADALRGLYTDDFVYVHSGAAVIDSKESWLQKVPATKSFYTGRSKEAVDVRTHGSVAWVSYVLITEIDAKKFPLMPPRARAHQLRIYVKTQTDWKLAYQHLTWAVRTTEQQADVMRYLHQQGYYNELPPAAGPAANNGH